MNISKTFVLVFCVLVLACPLRAQYDVPNFLRSDTLNVKGQTVHSITYLCDGDYLLYKFKDTVSPRIVEVLYADSTFRERRYYNDQTDNYRANITYNRDGTVSTLYFQIEYKGVKYDCPVHTLYSEKGYSSALYIQDERGHIVTEYWCYNGKWKWQCHHNCKPPRYAKKLFRMFLDQYETKLYMLDHGIWFEP